MITSERFSIGMHGRALPPFPGLRILSHHWAILAHMNISMHMYKPLFFFHFPENRKKNLPLTGTKLTLLTSSQGHTDLI